MADQQQDYGQVVGMSLEQAQNYLQPLGVRTVRVTTYNNQPMIVTADHRMDRLNVAVNNDVITAVGGLG